MNLFLEFGKRMADWSGVGCTLVFLASSENEVLGLSKKGTMMGTIDQGQGHWIYVELLALPQSH